MNKHQTPNTKHADKNPQVHITNLFLSDCFSKIAQNYSKLSKKTFQIHFKTSTVVNKTYSNQKIPCVLIKFQNYSFYAKTRSLHRNVDFKPEFTLVQ